MPIGKYLTVDTTRPTKIMANPKQHADQYSTLTKVTPHHPTTDPERPRQQTYNTDREARQYHYAYRKFRRSLRTLRKRGNDPNGIAKQRNPRNQGNIVDHCSGQQAPSQQQDNDYEAADNDLHANKPFQQLSPLCIIP
ncbi:hypothetical protein LMG18101_00436 [Ralstonia flaminis]|uniref:Uncharacterized protein n=1 Tax=Ralstonia flaminis TaxID=3058597 RepID=A0ABM9JYR2_9RALS|nr:hypothetical protein LMG18101_00436 [Ralstonia sp. LMG 18101]